MNRTARFVVLASALTSLFAALSPAAGAVTWTNTGSTAIHATGTGVSYSVGANNYACTGTTATATAPTHSALTTYSVPGTLTYSPCTLAGQNTYIHCGFTFTGVTSPDPSSTVGVIDMTCVQRLTSSNTALCHFEGARAARYINPTAATSTPGKFTLPTNGTGLTVTHSSGSSCVFGVGTAHVQEEAITVTSVAGSPVLTRQA